MEWPMGTCPGFTGLGIGFNASKREPLYFQCDTTHGLKVRASEIQIKESGLTCLVAGTPDGQPKRRNLCCKKKN